MSPSVDEVLTFLLYIFQGENSSKGVGYSALNTCRSALSSVIRCEGVPIGQHRDVSLFMKAAFNQKPALAKSNFIWDTSEVLSLLRQWSPVVDLDIKRLTQKLLMLILLILGQRGQTAHALCISGLQMTQSAAFFTIDTVLKTTRPGAHMSQIMLKRFPEDENLCVVGTLQEYLQRTEVYRAGEDGLFLTCKKPYKRASRDSMRRWTKETLSAAGIDMTKHKPHSTRAASVSKAKAGKLPLASILSAAGWTQESTFSRFYEKEVTPSAAYQDTILKQVDGSRH